MPIKAKCPNADCGKVIAVKDEFAGKRAKCPGCGTVITIPNGTGVAAAPAVAPAPARRPAPPPPVDDEGFEEPRPAKRRAAPPPPPDDDFEEGGVEVRRAPKGKSGLVTAIAVINFVLGGLALLCGAIMLAFASMFTGASAAIATTGPMLVAQVPQPGQGGMPKGFPSPEEMKKLQEEAMKKMQGDPQFQDMMKKANVNARQGRAAVSGALAMIGTIIMIISIVNILWGGAAIAGGVGLLKRRNWGRILTLVLGGVAGTVGILYLVTMFMGAPAMSVIPSFLIYVGYAAFVFIVLLKPDIRREFA